MAKTGISVVRIVNEIESQFNQWQNKAAALQAKFVGGQPVPIDQIALEGYHDARRSLEVFDAMQARIVAKSWVAEVRAEGVNRHGVGYDIVAEAQAFRSLLGELQDTITTAIGIDANGFVSVPYIKLTNTGPFFATVDPATYAPINTKLQEIVSVIED